MNDLNGILAIWYREAKVFSREKSRIVASIVTPVLWLFVFGAGLGGRVAIPGASYQAFIYPGILGQAVLFSSIFFLSGALFPISGLPAWLLVVQFEFGGVVESK